MSEFDKGGIAGHYIKQWTETPTEIISCIDHECRSILRDWERKRAREREREMMVYGPTVSAEFLFCEHLSLLDCSQMGNTDLFTLSTESWVDKKRREQGERRADWLLKNWKNKRKRIMCLKYLINIVHRSYSSLPSPFPCVERPWRVIRAGIPHRLWLSATELSKIGRDSMRKDILHWL